MMVSGIVEKGKGEAGPIYGLPTANITIGGWFRPGIYSGKVTVSNKTYGAAICYGASKDKLEAHLLDFSGDLYGQTITVEILDKVSDIDPMISVEQMRDKIQKDLKKVKLCLQE
ncbi:MAG: riboflavin kinase [Patescibacteria group bacterium]|jgi:FAD synthase